MRAILDAAERVRGRLPPHLVPALVLALALSTAFVVGFLPKRNDLLPLHVDEWTNYDRTLALIRHESGLHYEAGFQVLIAQLQLLTGLDWTTLFRWLPALFFSISVLLTYLVGQRLGCGLESAFLASLVPTTIRFLGPSFLVPVALMLVALPLLLWLLSAPAFGARQALLCGLVFVFVGLSHPVSAPVMGLVVFIYSGARLLANRDAPWRARVRSSTLALLSVGLPALLVLAWRHDQLLGYLPQLVQTGERTPLPLVRDAIAKFGLLPVALGVLGIMLLILRGGWERYALAASAMALLLVVALYNTASFGFQTLADRSWLYLLLLLAVLGGYTIGWLRRSIAARMALWRPTVHFASLGGPAVAFALVATSLAVGIKGHLQEQYYQLASAETVADFQWIKDYLTPAKRGAVVRTDLAIAYRPLTDGGQVYATEAFPLLNQRGREAMTYLYGGEASLGAPWLRLHGNSIVYAPHWQDTPIYLDQPRPGIFVPSGLARSIFEGRD